MANYLKITSFKKIESTIYGFSLETLDKDSSKRRAYNVASLILMSTIKL